MTEGNVAQLDKAPEMEPLSPPPPDTSFEERASKFAVDDMGDKVKEPPKPAPAKQPAKPEQQKEPPKPVEQKQEPPKEQEKPAEEKPVETQAEKPKPRPWEMYHNAKKELENKDKELATIKAEFEQFKKQAQVVDPTEHPEFQKIKTRAQELEDHIKYVDYTKSDEFKNKYDQPYKDLSARLTTEATELMIEDAATGNVRALQPDEFWNVVRAETAEQAYKAAKALFPDDPAKVSDLVGKRRQIAESWRARAAALTEFKTKGAEREQQMTQARQKQEQAAQQQAMERAQKFHEFSEAALKDERLKEYFTAAEDDPKGKELLTKGFKEADKAFGIGDAPAEGEDEVAIHASVRNKAGSWLYLRYKMEKYKGELEQARKELDGYKKSQPTSGSPQGGAAPQSTGDDVEDRMMRWVEQNS